VGRYFANTLGIELLTVQYGGESKDWRTIPEVGATEPPRIFRRLYLLRE
jgi:hypothetical protein